MKSGREKGKKWFLHEIQSPNTGTHKEGEEGDLLFIVVPYPIRYCTYAVPIEEEDVVVLLSFATIGGDGDKEETNTIK